jgi:hypothetical protein
VVLVAVVVGVDGAGVGDLWVGGGVGEVVGVGCGDCVGGGAGAGGAGVRLVFVVVGVIVLSFLGVCGKRTLFR